LNIISLIHAGISGAVGGATKEADAELSVDATATGTTGLLGEYGNKRK